MPPEANLEGKGLQLDQGLLSGTGSRRTHGYLWQRATAFGGLLAKGSTVPPKGAKLFSGDREVGWISSSTLSPEFKAPIALGFPLRDFSAAGTMLTIEVGGTRYEATVQVLPFHHAKP